MLKQPQTMYHQFIQFLIKDGNKKRATQIVNQVIDTVGLPTFQSSIQAISPLVTTKSSKLSFKNVLIPTPLTEQQRNRLAFSWLLKHVKGKGRVAAMIGKELKAIEQGTSSLLQKREQVHKQALANKSNLILMDRRRF